MSLRSTAAIVLSLICVVATLCLPGTAWAAVPAPTVRGPIADAGASFPMRYAVSAAIHHLNNWVRTGHAPPGGPPYTFDAGVLARDEFMQRATKRALNAGFLPPEDAHDLMSRACAAKGHWSDPGRSTCR